ncbi:MAG: enoyl-CoA hydratase/isomerase family protein [Pyrinomonadaceae bacterium]
MGEAPPGPGYEIKEVAPSVSIIRFNKPAERNPLSKVTLTNLKTALPAVLSSMKTQTIIFTGADDVFLSGANIREVAQLDSASATEFAQLGLDLFQSIACARQRTIAAINGYCMGGGLDLALACQVRIASVKAKFAHPGARLGMITGWGGTQRLPRLIGRTRALELLVTARMIDAAEALRMGLVDGVADPVIEHALEIAAKSHS